MSKTNLKLEEFVSTGGRVSRVFVRLGRPNRPSDPAALLGHPTPPASRPGQPYDQNTRLGRPTRPPDPVILPPDPAVRPDRQTRPPDSAARLIRSTRPPTDACGVCAYKSLLYSRFIQYTTICIRIYIRQAIEFRLHWHLVMVVTATLVYPAIGEERGAITFLYLSRANDLVSSSAYFLPPVMKFHMWNFTCEISHVKFHMWLSHVKFHMYFHMWNFTCEISRVNHMWNFACEISQMKFHMWSFTCEISHVKFHTWNFTCDSHVKFHMWNFTCHSHVKFHMWNFLCEISHVKFHMWKYMCFTWLFTCEVPITHVKWAYSRVFHMDFTCVSHTFPHEFHKSSTCASHVFHILISVREHGQSSPYSQ